MKYKHKEMIMEDLVILRRIKQDYCNVWEHKEKPIVAKANVVEGGPNTNKWKHDDDGPKYRT